MTVTVFGGYGVFGALVARALTAAGLPVRIAGRDGERAARFAAELGAGQTGIAADVRDSASCARALAGARVAVCCAGPFSDLPTVLPEACLAAGVHYVDIADDRGWFARLRALDGRFRDRGLTAAVGCSSLPGISGALALLAAEHLPAVDRARMAALPAAYVAQALWEKPDLGACGTVTAWEVLGARGLLDRLTAAGYEVLTARLPPHQW